MNPDAPDSFTPKGLPLTFDDALAILNDRKWYLVIPLIGISLLSLIGAAVYPPKFVSTAKIVVESQQIPEELVQSTITTNAAERIDYITQRVLTRERILTIIRELELYQDAGLSDTDAVRRFRNNVIVELVSAGLGVRMTSQTIAFAVSFSSPEPEVATKVANELVTMYLNENVKTRSARAAQTTEFLAQESERIRQQTVELETLISAFKEENRTVMPELVEMNLSLMQRYENEYKSTELALEELAAERRILELQREQFAQTGDSSEPTLVQLERAYQEVLIRNTPSHPDAVEIRRKIQDLKSKPLAEDAENALVESDLIGDPAYARLVAQLEAVARKERLMRTSRNDLRRKLDELEERIARSPTVEREFLDLQRDLENLEAKYQEMKNKELQAKISQNLEEDQKGERFSLLEPAVQPQNPETPGKLIIVAAGCLVALGAGLGLVAARELLAPGIRSHTTFARLLGAEALIDIPEFGGTKSSKPLLLLGAFILFYLAAMAAAGVALQLELISVDQLNFISG